MENFYYTELDENYKNLLIEKFNDEKIIKQLVLLHIIYINFDDEIKDGNIVCNKKIVEDLIYIFKKLYLKRYKIEKVDLIDKYNFDDNLSMQDNNSSCFNYRKIPFKNKISNHAYGLAIDINPLYNPYIFLKDEKVNILPQNGIIYIDRKLNNEHYIKKDDYCYNLFKERGFEWGGDWEYPDYQHFQKEC